MVGRLKCGPWWSPPRNICALDPSLCVDIYDFLLTTSYSVGDGRAILWLHCVVWKTVLLADLLWGFSLLAWQSKWLYWGSLWQGTVGNFLVLWGLFPGNSQQEVKALSSTTNCKDINSYNNISLEVDFFPFEPPDENVAYLDCSPVRP